MTERQKASIARFLAAGVAAFLLYDSLVLRFAVRAQQAIQNVALFNYDLPIADGLLGFMSQYPRMYAWELSGFVGWTLALAGIAAALGGRLARTALAALAIASAVHGPMLSATVASALSALLGLEGPFNAPLPPTMSSSPDLDMIVPMADEYVIPGIVAQGLWLGLRLLLVSAAVALVVAMWRTRSRPATA